jgi:hypothetical protein
MEEPVGKIADDLLYGAGALALEVLGADTKPNRRKVYHWHEKGLLPTWNQGGEIVSRKSLLEKHFAPPASLTEVTE